MSISMWSYRPEVCDGGGCPGDCDLCDKPKNMEDEQTAHKVVGGGERDGSTCWFECDNCGLSVDIGDVFCKHCGARFVP